MRKATRYLGLDVHAETIAVAIAEGGREGEVRSLGTIPNRPEAVKRLMGKLGRGKSLRVCYEAGPCGYALYWQLIGLDVSCEVVAPTLVPVKPGDRVKTDRRDAIKLARSYRAGELTPVWVPDKAHEALRDLVRAREAAKKDQLRARHRLGKFLLRQGLRAPTKMKTWGVVHMNWVRSLRFERFAQQATFVDYLAEIDHSALRLERLERAIDQAVQEAPLETRVIIDALQALRGVAKTTAVTLVSEIGRLSRFSKARQLMGYSGLVPSEHSSGGPGKARRGGITKTGNAHLRRVLVEAAWCNRHRPALSAALKRRQAGLNDGVRELAWKAQHRLSTRYRRLAARGIPSPKIVTAVARELLGFIWAIGVQVEHQHAAKGQPRLAA